MGHGVATISRHLSIIKASINYVLRKTEEDADEMPKLTHAPSIHDSYERIADLLDEPLPEQRMTARYQKFGPKYLRRAMEATDATILELQKKTKRELLHPEFTPKSRITLATEEGCRVKK